MHILAREVRFSINPFAKNQYLGNNSYACKPTGPEGLSIYLALWVNLSSELNPDTGFVVNVTEIDKAVRKVAIPVISENVSADYGNGYVPTLERLGNILQLCWKAVAAEFVEMQVKKLLLKLNPYRSLSIESEDSEMLYYSEKFEFSAMHQLWNDKFDNVENDRMFGKCANPSGHGHNYILEVKVTHPEGVADSNWILNYQKTVKELFVDIVDHKNLNIDVSGFEPQNPTVENLARFAWEKLAEKFNGCKLCSIIIWENDRTYCEYSA